MIERLGDDIATRNCSTWSPTASRDPRRLRAYRGLARRTHALDQ
jgi:hypothetical protein